MWICICNAVNERRIIEAIDNGTTTWKQLCKELKIASQCGTCAITAKKFFERERLRLQPTSSQ